LLILQISIGILGFANIIIVGKHLSPAEYSSFAFILSIYNVFAVFISPIRSIFNTKLPHLYKINRLDKVKSLITTILKLICVFILCFTLLIAIFTSYIAYSFKLSNIGIIYLACCLVALNIFLEVFKSLANAKMAYNEYSEILYIEAILRLVTTLVLINLEFNSQKAILSYIIGSSVALVWALLKNKCLLSEKSSNSKYRVQILTFLPFLLYTTIIVGFNSGDMILAKHILSPNEAGFYGAAAQISKIFIIIGSAFTVYMFPLTSANVVLKKPVFRNIMKSAISYFVIGLILVICLWFVKDKFITIIFSQDFLSAIDQMIVLSIAMIFLCISQLLFQLFLVLNKLWLLALLLIIGICDMITIYLIGSSGFNIALIHLIYIILVCCISYTLLIYYRIKGYIY